MLSCQAKILHQFNPHLLVFYMGTSKVYLPEIFQVFRLSMLICLLAQSLTSVAGSSHWFETGLVTYSNAAKINYLGVNPLTLEQFGAVSEQTAAEMASGAASKVGADCAISVTGIAGPGGGTEQKPVGMVCFGFAVSGRAPVTVTEIFEGDRRSVRAKSVEFALSKLLTELD